ncbi:TetR/AcrR family transcriptional regulator [Gordonia insulae]|uniref:TetR/AcrR family transcriptional regulator n=1 Tax=Gordonia insulae TaxID=2420509 RepID=UPI000F5C1D35|nr:TetR/AcrR family transcriptional regulator [Gordonia insulae]
MTPPAKKRTTASRTAKERYLEAGLQVLAEKGHAGLKLATVCATVGATTGSFYHAFASWGEYTTALIRYWREEESDRPIAEASAVTDPVERLQFLIDIALRLPHDSEAAIRVWAEHDADVRVVQIEADEERHRFISDSYFAVFGDREVADRYATAAMYLLVGYESGTHRAPDTFAWVLQALVKQALDEAGVVIPTRE